MIKIIQGDALERLRELPDGSVHCCITSPPYWGLRDYGVEGQLGSEPTFEEFLEKLVALFAEVKRVLHPSGSAWINHGDSYNGDATRSSFGDQSKHGYTDHGTRRKRALPHLHPKNLVGQPWRLAFALQDAGWILRKDIIWHKPTAMPEPPTDRVTSAHEYLFHLTKSGRSFFDGHAIREPLASGIRQDRFNGRPSSAAGPAVRYLPSDRYNVIDRAKRSVWSIPSEPFPDAHFACVDADTEALTAQGWKTYDQLVPDVDLIANYHPGSHQLEWLPLLGVSTYPVEDLSMVSIKSTSTDQLLTDNHTCLVRERSGARKIIEAGRLRPAMQLPLASSWRSAGVRADMSLEFAELLGWIVAEGGYRKDGGGIFLYQSRSANPQHVERLRHLLESERADFTYHERIREWRPKGRPPRPSIEGTFYLKAGCPVGQKIRTLLPEKILTPGLINSLNELQTAALLHGIVSGDGHVRRDGRAMIVQKDYQSIGLMQMLALRLGYRAIVTKRSKGDTHQLQLSKNDWVTLRATNGVHRGKVDYQSYTGIVWCPSTVTGLWLARKNGKPFITGNTFPTSLVEPCIKAGTSERGCCPKCFAPWTRILEKGEIVSAGCYSDNGGRKRADAPGAETSPTSVFRTGKIQTYETAGWAPSCKCDAGDPVPCVVLDPFSGSGTTGLVAARLFRHYIGIELNPEYVEMARKRIEDDRPLFNNVEVVA